MLSMGLLDACVWVSEVKIRNSILEYSIRVGEVLKKKSHMVQIAFTYLS